jgi:hypothetical protein
MVKTAGLKIGATGLEEVVAAELSAGEIGASDVRPGKAGVTFRSATPRTPQTSIRYDKQTSLC